MGSIYGAGLYGSVGSLVDFRGFEMSGRKFARNGTRRRAKKTDANESEIILALEKAGCTVVPIGKPLDLLVGLHGVTHILEVKNPDGKNRLEPDQVEFIEQWRGRPPVVVRTVDEALLAVGVVTGLRGTMVRVAR